MSVYETEEEEGGGGGRTVKARLPGKAATPGVGRRNKRKAVEPKRRPTADLQQQQHEAAANKRPRLNSTGSEERSPGGHSSLSRYSTRIRTCSFVFSTAECAAQGGFEVFWMLHARAKGHKELGEVL